MGTQQNPNQPTDEEPELSDNVVRAINAAVSSQLKRATKDMVTKGDLEALSTSLVEKVTAALPKPDDAPKGKGKGEPDPEIQKLAKDLETVKAAHAAAEKRAKDAETKAAIDRASAQIGQLLGGGLDPKLKVKPEFVELLQENFARRLQVGEDGTVSVPSRRAPARGLPEEDVFLTPEDAVRDWFKSDKAKAFIPAPAPGGGGVGARRQAPALPAGSPPAAASRGESEEAALRRVAESLPPDLLNRL